MDEQQDLEELLAPLRADLASLRTDATALHVELTVLRRESDGIAESLSSACGEIDAVKETVTATHEVLNDFVERYGRHQIVANAQAELTQLTVVWKADFAHRQRVRALARGLMVMALLSKKPEQRPQHARAVIRHIRQVEHTPDVAADGSGHFVPTGAPHANTDYVDRIREAERRIWNLFAENGEYHSSVIEARFTLAELTGESGDSRGAADQYETLGEDCKRFFGPADPRALNAFDAMARWIAASA